LLCETLPPRERPRRTRDDANRMNRRLAIFSVGGLGVGAFAEGQPTMTKIVLGLARALEVTFYSLVPTASDFEPSTYRLRSPSKKVAESSIKGALWLALARSFQADHRATPYDALLSMWGYPMGTFVVALSRLSRRPSAAVFLGSELARVPEAGYGALRRPVARRLVQATCKGLTAAILCSRWQLHALDDVGAGRENAHLIPWGADKRLFRFEPKTFVSPLKIVHVANLSPVKDQATLVKAFAILRERMSAKLRIVGGDFMRGSIHALVRRLRLSDDVEFTGSVRHSAVYSHYRWADMCVQTSLSEGQNGAVTEAMMCGVLVVSTPVGIAADLGEDSVVTVQKGDPYDVAGKIQAIARDPAEWKSKVQRAREWTESHDLDWTIDRLTHLLRHLHGR